MVGLRRIRLLPAALVALVLVSATRAQDTVDFDFYPEGAQDCLYEAAESSKCESATVPATNACLCRNGGDFITTAAACLGRSSQSNLRAVYRKMRDACDFSDTPINITEDEFNDAARGETPTTTSATTSSTGTAPPPTPTGDDNKEDEESTGLSTGALAGIIAGAIGGCAVLGAVAYLLFRRRRKLGEESHPMLPPQHPHAQAHAHHHLSMAPSGRESTAYYGSPPTTAGWPNKDWGGSPDLRQSGFWESPAHLSQLSYPGGGGGALAPSPPLPIQELDGAPHYPSGSTEAPVEMGGTPVATTPPPVPPPPPSAANAQYQPYQPPQQYPGPAWSPPQQR